MYYIISCQRSLEENNADGQTSQWIIYFDVSLHFNGQSSKNLHYTAN